MIEDSFSINRDCSHCEQFTGDFKDCRSKCTQIINPGYLPNTRADTLNLIKNYPHL